MSLEDFQLEPRRESFPWGLAHPLGDAENLLHELMHAWSCNRNESRRGRPYALEATVFIALGEVRGEEVDSRRLLGGCIVASSSSAPFVWRAEAASWEGARRCLLDKGKGFFAHVQAV